MTEEYLELYKKYRPQRWQDLVGKEGPARTLQAEVKTGRVPTAHGLFGPHGCGKTTSALIFAKALNCENLQKGYNPCLKCSYCVDIENGTQIGVNYISMANRSGVDDARSIAERASTQQPLKKQIWILDEAHNMSQAAFDALLIPLEKNKMHSHFMFCSTAITKIPDTILSRIHQLKFRRVPAVKMTKLLQNIAENEGFGDCDDAIATAVRLGRGSVRDAISSFEAVLKSGYREEDSSGKLVAAIASLDLTGALLIVAESWSEGVSPRDLNEALLEELRNLLMYASGIDNDFVEHPTMNDPDSAVKGLGGKRGIISALTAFSKSLTDIVYGSDGRITLETTIVDFLTRLKKAHARKNGEQRIW